MRLGWTFGAAVALAAMAPATAFAHVGFTAPADGSSFTAGETVTVSWEIEISHDLQNWDLELSDDGGSSWDEVAIDLPPDQLSYDWTVPARSCTDCLLRITMDNSGTDYDDTLTISITVPDGGTAGDAGVSSDAGTTADAGGDDAGYTPRDAGGESDAGGETDAGGGDDAGSGSGCSAAGGSGSGALGFAGLLALAMMIRRRQRARRAARPALARPTADP